MHGVSLYFGSPEKADRSHLKRLKTLVRLTNTPWVSNHLCWGSVDGTYSHDLLPMPYTTAAAKATAAKIRYVQDFFEAPIAVENLSSYAEFTSSTMTEWEFLGEVAERAPIDPVWKLYAAAIKKAWHTPTLLEWDDRIPSFDEVHNEALKATKWLDQVKPAATKKGARPVITRGQTEIARAAV